MHNTADKTATYVARNGKRFEDMVRQREGSNPKFSFLHELGEGGPYFKWKVYCFQNGISAEDQEDMMREAFPSPEPAEQENFVGMLASLSGSKEHIRALRSWIVAQEESRACIHWICEQLRHRILSNTDFNARLHIIYVINDVLHAFLKRRGEAPEGQQLPIDPVCEKMSKHMVRLLQPTFQAESNTTERAKLHKVVGLWRDRNIFSAQEVSAMEAAMMNGVPFVQPVQVEMTGLQTYQKVLASKREQPGSPAGEPPEYQEPPPHYQPAEPPPQYQPKPPLPPQLPFMAAQIMANAQQGLTQAMPTPVVTPAMAQSLANAQVGAAAPQVVNNVAPVWTSPEEIPPGLLVTLSNLMRQGGSPAYTPIPLQLCPKQPPPPQPTNPTIASAMDDFYKEPIVERIAQQAAEKLR